MVDVYVEHLEHRLVIARRVVNVVVEAHHIELIRADQVIHCQILPVEKQDTVVPLRPVDCAHLAASLRLGELLHGQIRHPDESQEGHDAELLGRGDPRRAQVTPLAVLQVHVVGDSIEPLSIECVRVGAAAHNEVVAVAGQPGGQCGRQEHVHVTSDEEVVAGQLEVRVVLERDQNRVQVAVLG